MLTLLAKIIPLDIAAVLSPGIFAITILLLGSKFRPKLKVFAFLLGTLVVAIGIALLGFFLGKSAPSDHQPNLTSAVIDAALAVIFILFAVRSFFSHERQIKSQDENHAHVLRLIILGFLVSTTNFDALFLSLTASREVSGADISSVIKLILVIINVLFFILPVTLPLFIYLILPNLAARVLEKINVFVLRYSRYIVSILFLVFGILLAWHALKYFLG